MKMMSKLYTTLVFVFLYAPIAILVLFSFNSSNSTGVFTGFSIRWYEELFRDGQALEALKKAGTTDPAKINEVLWDVTYTGVCGEVKFDSVNGDAERDVAYVKHVNTADGAWEFVTVAGVN